MALTISSVAPVATPEARMSGHWRLTNRKEATVSQHAAAFESTNEDPAESEAEAGAERERERRIQSRTGGRPADADRGRKEKPRTTDHWI